MQLLLILALLMYGGKSGGRDILSEVCPVLESLGGEEMKEAIKSAEEISEVLSAVQTFAEGMGGGPHENFGGNDGVATESESPKADGAEPSIAFPLAPIADIADREITYSLSKYISASSVS